MEIALEVEGAELSGFAAEAASRRTVTVAAGGKTRIDWSLRVVSTERVRLRASAIARANEAPEPVAEDAPEPVAEDAPEPVATDAVELVVPVNPHGRDFRLRFAGRARPSERWRGFVTLPDGADAETASLELRLASTRLDVIAQALPFLAGYPYGCVEQTMSRFLPAVIASRTSARFHLGGESLRAKLPLMVERGLRRLYGFQHDDGGWGWWTHDETNAAMTAYVVQGLARARAAGYKVEDSAIAGGVRFLAENAARRPDAIYARKLPGDDDLKLDEAEAPSPDDLEGRTYLVLAGRRDLAADLRLEPPDRGGSRNIERVALVIEALASVNAGDARIEPLADWLVSWRTGRAWASTLDSARAVYALAALARDDTESGSPDVRVTMNGVPVAVDAGRATLRGDAIRRGENVLEVGCDARTTFVTTVLAYRDRGEMLGPVDGGIAVKRRLECRASRDGDVAWASSFSV